MLNENGVPQLHHSLKMPASPLSIGGVSHSNAYFMDCKVGQNQNDRL